MKGGLKRLTAAVVLLLAFVLVFVGCASSEGEKAAVYVVSIAQTAENEDGTEYTVYYSDGTTSTFVVADGKDGADGQNGKDGADITAADLYEEYVARYGEDLTYAEFLEKYLSLSQDNETAVPKAVRSVVSVYSEFTTTTYSGGVWGGMQEVSAIALSGGSGVIYGIGEDYTYIVTNYHVVYNNQANEDNGSKIARKIVCYLYGSESAPYETNEKGADGYNTVEYGENAVVCEFIGGSVTYDIAILRAETASLRAINPDYLAAELADGYTVGETAIAVGNAEGEGLSVTQGIVSVDGEYVTLDDIDGTARQYRSIRIDTAIYPGNSGGGLFNAEGKLIGITNAGDGTDQNVNFAIPLDIVRGVADNLLFYYGDGDSATTGAYKITLGVTVTSENIRYVYDEASGSGRVEEQISVSSVTDGSIAQSLGLSEGDILLSFNVNGAENTLARSYELGDMLLTVRAGDSITFSVLRGGQTVETESYTVLETDLVSVE